MSEVNTGITLDEFVMTAMQIILHAGNSRDLSQEAVKAAREGDMEKAEKDIKEARKEIVEAHKYQTEILQKEMRYEQDGNQSQVPLLFIHAQDTIMTITTEVNLREETIEILKEMKEKA